MKKLIILSTYLFLFGSLCGGAPTPSEIQIIQEIEKHKEAGSIDDLIELRKIIVSKKHSKQVKAFAFSALLEHMPDAVKDEWEEDGFLDISIFEDRLGSVDQKDIIGWIEARKEKEAGVVCFSNSSGKGGLTVTEKMVRKASGKPLEDVKLGKVLSLLHKVRTFDGNNWSIEFVECADRLLVVYTYYPEEFQDGEEFNQIVLYSTENHIALKKATDLNASKTSSKILSQRGSWEIQELIDVLLAPSEEKKDLTAALAVLLAVIPQEELPENMANSGDFLKFLKTVSERDIARWKEAYDPIVFTVPESGIGLKQSEVADVEGEKLENMPISSILDSVRVRFGDVPLNSITVRSTSYGAPVVIVKLSADTEIVCALMLSSESFRLFPKGDGNEKNIEIDPVIRGL